jgi:hypothetical protein
LPGDERYIEVDQMFRMILICLLLLTSSTAYAQMSESEGKKQIEQAVGHVEAQLRQAVSEYEAAYDRRTQLEIRLHRERGEQARNPAPKPPISGAYLEARAMMDSLRDEEARPSAQKLEKRTLEMRARVAALTEEIHAVRRANEALAAHLETLRNEDFPPH